MWGVGFRLALRISPPEISRSIHLSYILWECSRTLKHKVDNTIKEPESASRIGVVIKWHMLELSILRQEFIFEFHYLPTSANPQAEVFNSHATLQSREISEFRGLK
jgi:hypothetical protein